MPKPEILPACYLAAEYHYLVALAVPTVVDFSVEGSEPMMVTPREVDLVIENAAKTVAFALNKALQPELELEEILALIQ